MCTEQELVTNLSREIIMKVTIDGQIIETTANCFNILGYEKEEMVGYNLLEFIKSDSLENIFNEEDSDIELIFTHKKSELKYIDVKKVVLKKDNNEKVFLFSMLDITKYKEEKNFIRRTKRILDTTDDIIYSFDIKPELKFNYLNPAVYTNLGYSIDEHDKNPMIPFDIIHPDDYELEMSILTGEIDYSKGIITRFKHKEGKYIWFENFITPIYDENNDLITIEGVTRNIQERKEIEEKLEYLSYHDGLTGLYNRTYFEKEKLRLNQEDTKIGVVVCDLDNMKNVNDTLGHVNGDELIKRTARLIENTIIKDSIICRIGGDEIIILIKDIEYNNLQEIIKNLRKTIENYNFENEGISIKMSIGSSYSDKSIGLVNKVINTADSNMYKEKRKNKHID